MKFKWIILLCAMCLVIGGMICQAIRKPQTEIVEVQVIGLPELIMLDSIANKNIQVLKDMQQFSKSWKFVTTEGETVFVDSTTPYGSVPIVKTRVDIPVTIEVDKQQITVPFWLVARHKGEIFDYEVGVWEDRFTIVRIVKKRWVNLGGYSALLVNSDLLMAAEVEGDLTFWEKIALFGRAYMDQDRQANVAIGVKYIF